MRTPSALVSLSIVMATTSASHAVFTGFSRERVITAAGNTQYSIYANFDSVGLPSGKSWVFLNAYNYQGVSGSMNARHQDAAEDLDGNPTSSWSATANLLGTAARDNDSWVSASGSGTSAGADASLDPSFNNTVFDRIVGSGGGAGWFDATPGAQNLVAAGGTSGFRIKLIQIVRTGNDNLQGDYVGSMFITYKVQDTSAPLAGSGSFNLVPAPGAVALAGLAGLTGRRRR
jgi:hypothetical protein